MLQRGSSFTDRACPASKAKCIVAPHVNAAVLHQLPVTYSEKTQYTQIVNPDDVSTEPWDLLDEVGRIKGHASSYQAVPWKHV